MLTDAEARESEAREDAGKHAKDKEEVGRLLERTASEVGIKEGCTHFMQGCTIDPRIPTKLRRSMSGFHRPGRHCMHQARSTVRCSLIRVKSELHPTKNHL